MLKPETVNSLQVKQEELANLFIVQTDLEAWNDLPRGDAYWERKNCAQTLGLVVRLQTILDMHQNRHQVPIGEGGDVDTEKLAKKATADANALIKRIRAKV